MGISLRIIVFLLGFGVILGTFSSALSTFVVPRSVRSKLNRTLFGLLRRVFEGLMVFAKSFRRKDAIFAFCAPLGLMLLVPTWYILMAVGYAAMYWSLGAGVVFTAISISRDEFEAVLARLKEAGVPLKADRGQAWQDFAGWRVNYDHTLLALCRLVMAPQAFWSSDRTLMGLGYNNRR